MDNKNTTTNNTTTNNTTTNNTTGTAPAPQQQGNDNKLMEMKLAYTQFEAEARKNRTFGEKLVDSLPYVVAGLALGASAVAVGASIKALDTAKKVSEETRAIPTTWSPAPDGDLE